jgi:hypothetical protein
MSPVHSTTQGNEIEQSTVQRVHGIPVFDARRIGGGVDAANRRVGTMKNAQVFLVGQVQVGEISGSPPGLVGDEIARNAA